MPNLLPVSAASDLLRTSLNRAAEQVSSVTAKLAATDPGGSEFTAAVTELSQAKLSVQTAAYVVQTLDELAGDLLRLPRK
jgi:hypothetical protein